MTSVTFVAFEKYTVSAAAAGVATSVAEKARAWARTDSRRLNMVCDLSRHWRGSGEDGRQGGVHRQFEHVIDAFDGAGGGAAGTIEDAARRGAALGALSGWILQRLADGVGDCGGV